MDGGPALGPVGGAAERLAVDGDQAILGDLLHRPDPAQQALLEGAGIESCQDASQGVVGGDALAQVEVTSEPVAAVGGEFVDRGEGVGPGQHAADGDEDDID
jgi:hypothetical protein